LDFQCLLGVFKEDHLSPLKFGSFGIFLTSLKSLNHLGSFYLFEYKKDFFESLWVLILIIFLQVFSIYNILEFFFLELFQSNLDIIKYYLIIFLQIFSSYLLENQVYINTICIYIKLCIYIHKVLERIMFFFLIPIFLVKNQTTTQDTLGGFNI